MMQPGQAKNILDKILLNLYTIPISIVYTNIAQIVHENIEMTLGSSNDDTIRYIRFDGEVYFSSNIPSYKDRQSIIYDITIPNRSMTLHESIKEQLIIEAAELKELNAEHQECAYYLRAVINQCNSLHDIKALLPDAVWSLTGVTPSDMTNDTLSLSDVIIKELKNTYATEAASVKERVFLNLLLRKV